MNTLPALLWVGLGSMAGGMARYALSRAVNSLTMLPLWGGTMAVNIAGCFLLGIVYGLCERYHPGGHALRLFLTVGFCGGFTTFSTFIHENFTALTGGRFLETAAYASLSLLLGLAAMWLATKITA